MYKTPEQQKQEMATNIIHSLAGFGFATLFGTFAIATQGHEVGTSAGVAISALVAGLCVVAAINEYMHYRNDKEHEEENTGYTHFLNGLAFLLAAGGAALISSDLLTTLPNKMGPVPAFLFVGTTLLLTISSWRNASKKGKSGPGASWPFILQMVGASFLVIGGFQSHGLSNILPNSGQSLHDLNIAITTFAGLAGFGALASILYVYRNYQPSVAPQQIDDDEAESDDHEMDIDHQQMLQ
jgi:Na+/H+ antiporter NhaD/arsenite permease-like protein